MPQVVLSLEVHPELRARSGQGRQIYRFISAQPSAACLDLPCPLERPAQQTGELAPREVERLTDFALQELAGMHRAPPPLLERGRNVYSPASAPARSSVLRRVNTLAGEDVDVSMPVIILATVAMVSNFATIEQPADLLFGHEPRAAHESGVVRARVLRTMNKNVAGDVALNSTSSPWNTERMLMNERHGHLKILARLLSARKASA